MLNAIHQAKTKFPFHLYALCIMSNHYLIKSDDALHQLVFGHGL
jgi:hypothetical protein